ncbi:MAG: long-chain-fatty-acid--CoA ligase [Acidimicrobiia bacterium]|nr:long-chain-fatty-acid--CoA ligase [Acidimicrobiia bacterium]
MSVVVVSDILRENLATQPEADAIVLDGGGCTWAQLYRRACKVANGLVDAGVGVGDRIAFLDKNSIEYFEVLFGATLVNAVLVAVNWRLAPPEIEYIINDADAGVLVVHSDFAEQLAAFAPNLTTVTTILVIGDAGKLRSYEEWVESQVDTDPHGDGGPDDVALQLYTSGTTGLPKGAQLTNQNFNALLTAAASWDMDTSSVSIAAMPLFHIGGSGWSLFGMAKGAKTVLLRELDPSKLLELITEEKATHAFFVPAVLQFLLLMPQDGIDLSSMKLIVYGASPITQEILVKSMEQFGCEYMQVYGLTETTGAVTQLEPSDHDASGAKAHLLRAAGKPLPGVEIKIVDTDTGDEVGDGVVGEVWIKSPTNMIGYWKMPDATAEALPGGGWFCTGDAGFMDDGYLFLHDRVKDMIISGGENVYPAEIENVLMSHDAVADAAVIGVPSQKWGETPKAIIVAAPGATVDAAELIGYCKERLAGFKCPTSVDLVESIARNPSGKILKRELRAPYWEGHERAVN